MEKDGVYLFGKGGGKWKEKVWDGNGELIENIDGVGKWMLGVGEKGMGVEDLKDVGYLEGLYVKELVGCSGKKVV